MLHHWGFKICLEFHWAETKAPASLHFLPQAEGETLFTCLYQLPEAAIVF